MSILRNASHFEIIGDFLQRRNTSGWSWSVLYWVPWAWYWWRGFELLACLTCCPCCVLKLLCCAGHRRFVHYQKWICKTWRNWGTDHQFWSHVGFYQKPIWVSGSTWYLQASVHHPASPVGDDTVVIFWPPYGLFFFSKLCKYLHSFAFYRKISKLLYGLPAVPLNRRDPLSGFFWYVLSMFTWSPHRLNNRGVAWVWAASVHKMK